MNTYELGSFSTASSSSQVVTYGETTQGYYENRYGPGYGALMSVYDEVVADHTFLAPFLQYRNPYGNGLMVGWMLDAIKITANAALKPIREHFLLSFLTGVLTHYTQLSGRMLQSLLLWLLPDAVVRMQTKVTNSPPESGAFTAAIQTR